MAEPRRSTAKDASGRAASDLKGARILVVEARFYEDIADALLAGATRALEEVGVNFDRVSVPGALEVAPAIAIAIDAAERSGRPYEGAVALGCVIRGETLHFEIVSQESARALAGLGGHAPLPDRQRHPHRRHRRPGLVARAPGRRRQGRRRCACGAFARSAGAPARRGPTMSRPGAPKDDRKANRRGAARLAAVQALYQMDIAGTGLNDILAEFESHWIGREVEGAQYLPAEAAFFRDVVSGVVREQRSLDPLVDKALAEGWPLKRIEAILRAVLRAGAYELGHRNDVPARVVVSEYVDVANAFVDKDETGMVNAVLDQIARRFRSGEFTAR